MPPQPPARDLRDRYLDLVERGVTHSLYNALDSGLTHGNFGAKNRALTALARPLRARGIEPVRLLPDTGPEREEGQDRPVFAQTLIGRKRIANLRACTETALKDGVAGDFIECGVWRGGAGIVMRAVLQAYGITDRKVWMADSFAGLPRPQADEYPADVGSAWHEIHEFAVPVEAVRDNFRRYGLLDDQVEFLHGWFNETLPTVSDKQWAVIRIDADMYGSTIEALRNLYPRLSPGGFLIVDDYASIEPARRAVDDYRRERGIQEPLQQIDWTGIYWRRELG